MGAFVPLSYQIVRDGRMVVEATFCSTQEILGIIARRLPEGVYLVFRIPPDGRAGQGLIPGFRGPVRDILPKPAPRAESAPDANGTSQSLSRKPPSPKGARSYSSGR